MNLLVFDIFYRQQIKNPTRWFQEMLLNQDIVKIKILSFQFCNLELKNITSFPQFSKETFPYSNRLYQTERSKYLKGNGRYFEPVKSKIIEFCKEHQVKKVYIFGNNFKLSYQLQSQGLDVKNIELGPMRAPNKHFLILTPDDIRKLKNEDIYSKALKDKPKNISQIRNREERLFNVIMPFQLKFDSSFFPDSKFSSMMDFLNYLLKLIKENNLHINLGVKIHPGIKSDLPAAVDHIKAIIKAYFNGIFVYFSLKTRPSLIITICSNFALDMNINGVPYLHFHDSVLGKGMNKKYLKKFLQNPELITRLWELQFNRTSRIVQSLIKQEELLSLLAED